MRTIDATLKAALASGSFNAYIKGLGSTEFDLKRYKLTGTSFEFESEEISTLGTVESPQVKLKRGVTISGVNYTLTSSLFYITERTLLNYQTQNFHYKIKADLFPKDYISIAGDDTYENVITAFCAQFNKTAVFDRPADPLWGYQFLAAGKNFTSNNAQSFLNLLRQKYFIFACDNGNEEVLFFQAMADREPDSQYNVWTEDPGAPDLQADDVITNNTWNIKLSSIQARAYVARTETQSVRNGGTPGKPIQNLGYLESTDDFPEKSSNDSNGIYETSPFLINLIPQDGDIVTLDPATISVTVWPIEIIEQYDPKLNPSWSVIIKQREVFTNTEGGALPSTIERVAAYTPLVTTNFDNNLDETVNNLQALAEAVDDLNMSGTIIEIDMGSTPIWQGRFTITNTEITTTHKVIVYQHPGPYTNKGTRSDEAELAPIQILSVQTLEGSAIVRWQTPPIYSQPIIGSGGNLNTLLNAADTQRPGPARINKIKGNIKFIYQILN